MTRNQDVQCAEERRTMDTFLREVIRLNLVMATAMHAMGHRRVAATLVLRTARAIERLGPTPGALRN